MKEVYNRMKLLYTPRVNIQFKISCTYCKAIYELMVMDLQVFDLQYYTVKTFTCEVCNRLNDGIKVPKSCLTAQEQIMVNNQ